MKTISFLWIFISPILLSGQSELRNYSYPVMGLDSAFRDGGTCFFIRDNSNIYLVTAKHVVSGCDDESTKSSEFPDFHYVFLGSYLHSIPPIDTKTLKRQLLCNGLDVFVMKITDTSQSAYIHSAEKFIVPNLSEFDDAVIFGYPKTIYNKDMFSALPKSDSIYIESKSFTFHAIIDENRVIDSTSVALNYKSATVKSEKLNGYSGSPVFLRRKKNNEWRLIGLFSASKDLDTNTVSLKIMKAEAIIDKIKGIN